MQNKLMEPVAQTRESIIAGSFFLKIEQDRKTTHSTEISLEKPDQR